MLTNLLLPIIAATVALFFASFLSWMILQLHKKDWVKIGKEDEFMQGMRNCDIPPGNYMFPGCNSPEEAKSEVHQKKMG